MSRAQYLWELGLVLICFLFGSIVLLMVLWFLAADALQHFFDKRRRKLLRRLNSKHFRTIESDHYRSYK